MYSPSIVPTSPEACHDDALFNGLCNKHSRYGHKRHDGFLNTPPHQALSAIVPDRLSKALFEITPTDILARKEVALSGAIGFRSIFGISNTSTYPTHLILDSKRKATMEQGSHDLDANLRSHGQINGCGGNSDQDMEKSRTPVPTYPAHLIPSLLSKKAPLPTINFLSAENSSNIVFEELLEDFIVKSTMYACPEYDPTDKCAHNYISTKPSMDTSQSNNVSDSATFPSGGESCWPTPCLSDVSSVFDISEQSPLIHTNSINNTITTNHNIRDFDLFGPTHLPSPKKPKYKNLTSPFQAKSSSCFILPARTTNKRKRMRDASVGITSKRHRCSLCSYEGAHTGNFNRHIQTHYIIRNKVACSLCGSPYANKYNLSRHVCKQSVINSY
ncbi:C2H2-type zinc finger transcription factor [Phycomyces blakesleeanus]|uniref:C2H2-type zinc finger transcription factor n=2 Tax=Phycomyces blakesleeanus TaxID=4837 RepID=A0A167MWC7_PHYB8|nr:C2H2-type zinc finger transcription factor [Phycomyces blakesleeanus NRRL 1555(-)]OAD74254.1 C2H2-type zinc finger transcription factor [Phycomyces blakesleeanus NRRL 1555(-)]|eukprot:XP_018292294.1 C2H2-type zinc finger transcription factor [Phycomyces blakesleeanus NRRL 1555(-)]